MRKIFFLLSLNIYFFNLNSLFAQESNLIRFPSLNNDGSKIAFSCQGDIWTVSSEGGYAVRLTIHDAYESYPKWSPDGKQIAFSSLRYGNNDIFVMNALGDTPRRLTYNSANDVISSWTKDREILFTTTREFQQVEREPEIYSIQASGGTEKRILDALGFEPALSPDGKFLAFVRGTNPITREEYRGPAQRDIWLFNTEEKSFIKLTTFDTNDYLPQWSDSRTIYFLSSINGKYNIFKVKIDDSGKAIENPKQITNFKDYAVRYFSISSDGSTIVLEQGKNIYLLKNDGSPQKVEVQVSADYHLDPVEFKSFTKDATEYAVSPNGKYVAFVIRGEIFVKEIDKEKNRSVNLSEHAYRDNDVVWLSDTTLIFASDREGNQYDLYLIKSSDKNQSNIFKSLKHEIIRITSTDEDESNPVISPDGKKIAYIEGQGRLVVADISADGKLSNRKILQEGWATPKGIAWSPDSKWLAYSLEDLYFNEEVYIHPADNSLKPVNVSMHPRGDGNPIWSADGSKLGFLSSRSTQNAITGGLSFTRDVWFVWLKKEDWEKTKQDWEDKEPAPEKKEDKPEKKDEKKDTIKVKPIKIDFEDIHKRLVQVTSFPGDESNLAISKDGETFYYVGVSSSAKGNDLYSIKWDGKDLKEITKGGSNPSSISIDKEGKYLYYFKTGGSLNRQDIKADKSETLPYAAKMKIDYQAERKQIFEEAWRSLRDGFYDPNFHGKNWQKLHDKYQPLCLSASTENDFRDMFNYMLGELNASHMGMFGSDRVETQKDATGQLGLELLPTKNGMLVKRVIPNSPADKSNSKIFIDELITAVDENKFDTDENFYSYLTNKAEEQVVLSVTGKEGKEREVVIRPSANIRQLLYEEWVEERRKLTEKYSNGRLGYIHIQGMS
ncbi:MAG: PDZ domain-containing protein, partial [Ignavibacteria bacterium]|nr:PDZ domain-containing protein [Ignavibacteria bacterium]